MRDSQTRVKLSNKKIKLVGLEMESGGGVFT